MPKKDHGKKNDPDAATLVKLNGKKKLKVKKKRKMCSINTQTSAYNTDNKVQPTGKFSAWVASPP